MIKYAFQGLLLPFKILGELLCIAPLYLIFSKIMLMLFGLFKKYAEQKNTTLYKIAGDLSWVFKYYVFFVLAMI